MSCTLITFYLCIILYIRHWQFGKYWLTEVRISPQIDKFIVIFVNITGVLIRILFKYWEIVKFMKANQHFPKF